MWSPVPWKKLRVEKWEREVREPIIRFVFKPTLISVPLSKTHSRSNLPDNFQEAFSIMWSTDNRCVRLEAAVRRMISVWHQNTARAIRKLKDPSALLSLSRYFDVIHWSFCAAPLQVEHTFLMKQKYMWIYWKICDILNNIFWYMGL